MLYFTHYFLGVTKSFKNKYFYLFIQRFSIRLLRLFSEEPVVLQVVMVINFRHTELVYDCGQHQSSQSSQLFTMPMQATVYSAVYSVM